MENRSGSPATRMNRSISVAGRRWSLPELLPDRRHIGRTQLEELLSVELVQPEGKVC
jgi:hypothetical protein